MRCADSSLVFTNSYQNGRLREILEFLRSIIQLRIKLQCNSINLFSPFFLLSIISTLVPHSPVCQSSWTVDYPISSASRARDGIFFAIFIELQCPFPHVCTCYAYIEGVNTAFDGLCAIVDTETNGFSHLLRSARFSTLSCQKSLDAVFRVLSIDLAAALYRICLIISQLSLISLLLHLLLAFTWTSSP